MLAETLSRSLQLPLPVLHSIASKASFSYKTYTIPKRRGGLRTIHHPSRELKAIQRWLLFNVINRWPVHDAAYAYRRRQNIGDNARLHAGGRYLLRMDLHDFFPSLQWGDLEKFLGAIPPGTEGWTNADAEFFLRIVCRERRLTIGAPTSPGLANALCLGLDRQITAIAADANVTYSRYADDLFFSASRPEVLSPLSRSVDQVITDLALPAGLRVNPEKTHHASRKGRRVVTGLILTPVGTVSVGRARKRFIRRQIHRLAGLGVEERKQLAGLIAFAVSIEPDLLNSLIMKYGPEAVLAARAGVRVAEPI